MSEDSDLYGERAPVGRHYVTRLKGTQSAAIVTAGLLAWLDHDLYNAIEFFPDNIGGFRNSSRWRAYRTRSQPGVGPHGPPTKGDRRLPKPKPAKSPREPRNEPQRQRRHAQSAKTSFVPR